MQRSTFAKASIAAAAAAMILGTAGAAQAQSYDYSRAGSYSYDPCKREKTGRTTAGALIGGAIGAVIGSQAAARGHRTDGSLLGGAVGAAVGAGVGNAGAACTPGQTAYTPGYDASPRYDSYDRYGSGYGGGYYGRDAYAPGYRYDSRYDGDWAYGRRGERYRIAQNRGVDRNGCTLAESPIYMPDGRTETRFVRVCRDSSGRYGVVD